jgi:hypothetical protein
MCYIDGQKKKYSLVLVLVRGWVNRRVMVELEGLSKVKGIRDIIGTRTRDLPACSMAPQPSTLPRAAWNAASLHGHSAAATELSVLLSCQQQWKSGRIVRRRGRFVLQATFWLRVVWYMDNGISEGHPELRHSAWWQCGDLTAAAHTVRCYSLLWFCSVTAGCLGPCSTPFQADIVHFWLFLKIVVFSNVQFCNVSTYCG